MARSPKVRLYDMLDAMAGIRESLAGVSFETFAATWHLRMATERGLEIISEASRHIPEDMRATEPNIPWNKIAGIGNVLRHDYQNVETIIVWRIVQDELGALEAAIVRLATSLS